MKRVGAIVALGVATLAVGPSSADNTDTKTATVSGTIVNALQLTASNMIMPHIVRPSASEPDSRVTMACGASGDATNTVTYTHNGNPFAHGLATLANPSLVSANRGLGVSNATGTCAVLGVSGQPDYYFLVGISAVANPSAPNVNVGNVSCTDELNNSLGNSSQGQLKPDGTLAVRCGASALVKATAGTSYSASFDFTVTYD